MSLAGTPPGRAHESSESERFAREVLDPLSAHIAVLDREGRILATNQSWRSFAEQNGLSADQVGVGADYLGVCDRSGASGAVAAVLIREILAGTRADGAFEYPCHAPWEERWFNCRATRLPDKEYIHVALAHENVTARVRAEREAARSQKQFRDLFELAPDALLLTTDEGRITMVNRRAEKLFGYAREDLLGESVGALLFQVDGARGATLSHVALEEMSRLPFGSRAVRRDGTAFPVDLSVGAIDSAEGPLTAVAVRDTSERVSAESALRNSLTEKELLLREIHHRVKNNLQIISSLLAMQSDGTSDATAQRLLETSMHRVRSMALIHERLYRSTSLARIDFGDYAHALTISLFRSYNITGAVELVVEAEALELNIETAVPCGLILNELVSNALKHAFTDAPTGTLHVLLRREAPGRFSLTVRDTGPGLSPYIDPENTASLGMRLVALLTKQIRGTFTIEREGGAIIRVDFAELPDAPR